MSFGHSKFLKTVRGAFKIRNTLPACCAHLYSEAWLTEARLVAAQGVPHVDHLFRPIGVRAKAFVESKRVVLLKRWQRGGVIVITCSRGMHDLRHD